MATSAAWRPSPTCAGGHRLERKSVSGSWFANGKKCTTCGAALKSGLVRHSCKTCNYHLCSVCQDARSEEMLGEEITMTVYRQAQAGFLPGMGNEEDAWQVRVPRGGTAGALKAQIFRLYGLSPALQVLRRSADEPPLPDSELLKYDDGDVIHLTGMGPGGGGGGLPDFGGLANAISSAMEGVSGAVSGAISRAEEQRRQLENTEYKLNILMPAQKTRSRPEKRCQLVVVAAARINEVLQMAKLELDMEDAGLVLEFAGERLPQEAPVFALNIQNGDTILLVSEQKTQQSL